MKPSLWLDKLLKELAAIVQGDSPTKMTSHLEARLMGEEGALPSVLVDVKVVGKEVTGCLRMVTYVNDLIIGMEDINTPRIIVKAIQLNSAKSKRVDASKKDTMFYITLYKKGEPILWNDRKALLIRGKDEIWVADN